MWLMLTVSALMKPRKGTVKANLGYIVRSRLAQATESDLISKTNKVKQTKAHKSTLFGVCMRRCKSGVRVRTCAHTGCGGTGQSLGQSSALSIHFTGLELASSTYVCDNCRIYMMTDW